MGNVDIATNIIFRPLTKAMAADKAKIEVEDFIFTSQPSVVLCVEKEKAGDVFGDERVIPS